MTSVEDFQPAARTNTRGSQRVDFDMAENLSPTDTRHHFNHHQQQHRRASNLSTTSGDGMRFRHRSRSNTVRTYHEPDQPNWQPGSEPGILPTTEEENIPPGLAQLRAACEINVVDFSESEIRHVRVNNLSLATLLENERPPTLPCRWISVNGLSGQVINALGNKYNLHPLAIEDLVHPHTRTKVDWYADHACIVLTLQKLVRLHTHRGLDGDCDCSAADREVEDKLGEIPVSRQNSELAPKVSQPDSRPPWWQFWSGRRRRQGRDVLPRYLDQNSDGRIDEFVAAHSGVSELTPIRPIRTLHRYESAQVPEHTAFMEKHSVLSNESLAVSVEQVSIFLLDDNIIISFFEQSAEDVEDPILERLNSAQTMIRRSCDASLLLQAIIDAIVDLAVPVRDAYNRSRKELQVDAMTNPDIKTSRSLHIFGEEVDMLQNLFRPIVHLVNALRDHNSSEALRATPSDTHRDDNDNNENLKAPSSVNKSHHKKHNARDRDGMPKVNRSVSDFRRVLHRRPEIASSVTITPLAHTYFGDVLDHCITIIQSFEQMDASANNISTLIFNTVGAKTNNFMMILAVVTVFFAPLTFISGYFGMNFADGSGLAHPFAFFWVIAIPSLVGFMLLVFATMLWDSITDFFAKRGIRAHRRIRRKTHGK